MIFTKSFKHNEHVYDKMTFLGIFGELEAHTQGKKISPYHLFIISHLQKLKKTSNTSFVKEIRVEVLKQIENKYLRASTSLWLALASLWPAFRLLVVAKIENR